MDTRFWGPSGWKLLHSITFAYTPSKKKIVQQLFETLPFVLPCKFCRASLTDYMKLFPLTPSLASKETLTRWLWNIHNQVNKKLREQRLLKDPDPPFEKVSTYYEEFLELGCSRVEFQGWDFLFSVAELHPLSKLSLTSIPINGYEKCKDIHTDIEKNRWNCLSPKRRLVYYTLFWKSLGPCLPFREWQQLWLKPKGLLRRKTTLEWLWKTRIRIEEGLKGLNRTKYSQLCKTLKHQRSNCAKSKNAKTCRKRRRNTLLQNRDGK